MARRNIILAGLLLSLAPLGALALTPEIDPDALEGRVKHALENADLESDYAEALAAGLQLIKLSRENRDALAQRVEATRNAEDEDVLLLTCLLDKQEELEKVLGKAQTRLGEVLDVGAGSVDVSTSLVVLAVYSQKIQLIAQEAGACTGADEEPGTSLDGIVAPEPPFELDLDPSGELGIPVNPGAPVDLPMVTPPGVAPPPIASPIR